MGCEETTVFCRLTWNCPRAFLWSKKKAAVRKCLLAAEPSTAAL